jgi:hypothetical protein
VAALVTGLLLAAAIAAASHDADSHVGSMGPFSTSPTVVQSGVTSPG